MTLTSFKILENMNTQKLSMNCTRMYSYNVQMTSDCKSDSHSLLAITRWSSRNSVEAETSDVLLVPVVVAVVEEVVLGTGTVAVVVRAAAAAAADAAYILVRGPLSSSTTSSRAGGTGASARCGT